MAVQEAMRGRAPHNGGVFLKATFLQLLLVFVVLATLGGCGGGSTGSSSGSGGSGSCTLGLNPGFCGVLSGLPSGKSLTLNFATSDAGGGSLTLNSNGPFAYELATQVHISTTWNVSVATSSPGTSCSVTSQGSNGSGGVRVQEITGVTVGCSTGPDYTIGGALAGLNSGAQITIKDNGGDPLTLTATGAFTFPTPVNPGTSYSVTVGKQPTNQLCAVSMGTGTAAANVTNVVVTCSNAFSIGGTLSGLSSGSQITLQDNGADSLALNANGAFTFPTPIIQGNTYNVTVASQPTNQFCSVTGGTGTVSSLVAGVQVACITIEQVLYKFTGGSSDGANPNSSLIMDSAGNLYGTTAVGGISNCNGVGCGTVFKLAPNGTGVYTESVLYSFVGGTDGAVPQAGLLMDSTGNLFGTTVGGGTNNFGTVFRLAPTGSGGYAESILYSFSNAAEGGPASVLVMDGNRNLYGTTLGSSGGSPEYGVVFKLAPNGAGGYTQSVLYAFTGGSDGASPRAGLIMDGAGNLYGTASGGGNNSCNNGCGTVFKLTPNGAGYTQSVLYTFTGGSDGGISEGGLIIDSTGVLYGTTALGGGINGGTVFRLTSSGTGGYVESVLHSFNGAGSSGPLDGESPESGLLMDSVGNLYGTTSSGGLGNNGAVFKLAPNGSGGYGESILHSFSGAGSSGAPDGANPQAGLISDSTGRIYSTTVNGGNTVCNNGCGIVFEVTPF